MAHPVPRKISKFFELIGYGQDPIVANRSVEHNVPHLLVDVIVVDVQESEVAGIVFVVCRIAVNRW